MKHDESRAPASVLVALTYYSPHISGLTIYVERLARELVRRGHRVTVLTSRFRPALPEEELVDGVRVRRLPVLCRLSKGVVQPTILPAFWAELRHHDIAHIHLPQGEGGLLAFIAKVLLRKKVIVTYHCDLRLPAGPLNRLVDRLVASMNRTSLRLADHVVTYTDDFARHSPLLRSHADKVVIIPPPIELQPVQPALLEAFRRDCSPDGQRVVAFVGRFAADKGLDCLVRAIPIVGRQVPGVRFVLAGPHEDVVGETVWRELRPQLQALGDAVKVLGPLPPAHIASFLAQCELLVLPSVNSTESFGMVQVEAMFCGVPVVASSLPGVRQPILLTGMGKLAQPGNAEDLASAIVSVLADREAYVNREPSPRSLFSTTSNADAYEALFERGAPDDDRPRAGP